MDRMSLVQSRGKVVLGGTGDLEEGRMEGHQYSTILPREDLNYVCCDFPRSLSEKAAAVPDTQASSCEPPSFSTQCLLDMLTFQRLSDNGHHL